MPPETPIAAIDPAAAAAAAVASARGAVPVRDWLATGTGAFDRYSAAAPDALVAVARGVGPAPVPRGGSRLLAAAGFVAGAWVRMRAARRAFRGVALPASADYVVRTWAGPAAFAGGGFTDPYFGRLAEWLGASGIRAVTVFGALSGHSRAFAAAAEAGGTVLPEQLFLRWGDPVAAAVETLRRRPRAMAGVSVAGRDVTALVSASVDEEHGRRQVFANRLQARIARRIAERLAPGAVALTHEGYAWERQFVFGLRDAAPAAWTAGYQHAPITPAQTALRVTAGADAGLPDRVVATGTAGAAELVRRGYPAERVAAGGSLKPAPLASVAHAPARPADAGDVLVVLGDFSRSVRTVAALRDLPGLVPGRRVVLRLHPLTPRDRFAAALGFDLAEAGFALSGGGALAEDLAGASAVVYDASAVVFEALAVGVPVAHFDLGDDLSLDPAADCGALRAEAADAAGVARALDAFAALSDDGYARQAAEARAFVEASLGEVTDATLAVFLPPGQEER